MYSWLWLFIITASTSMYSRPFILRLLWEFPTLMLASLHGVISLRLSQEIGFVYSHKTMSGELISCFKKQTSHTKQSSWVITEGCHVTSQLLDCPRARAMLTHSELQARACQPPTFFRDLWMAGFLILPLTDPTPNITTHSRPFILSKTANFLQNRQNGSRSHQDCQEVRQGHH